MVRPVLMLYLQTPEWALNAGQGSQGRGGLVREGGSAWGGHVSGGKEAREDLPQALPARSLTLAQGLSRS